VLLHLNPPSRSRLVSLGEGPQTVGRFIAELQGFKRSPGELAHVRALAMELVDDLPPNVEAQEIRRIFEHVRDAVRYTKDVRGVDTLQSPSVTLETRQGDCDDKALLLSALLESIGYATRFVVAATLPRGGYNHVYVEVLNPRTGRWIPLESSISSFPFGMALRTFEPVRRFA